MSESTPFQRYIDQARAGKTQLWRLAVGLVVIVSVWLIGTLAVVLAAVPLGILSGGADNWTDGFARTPLSLALMLLSFPPIWLGVWLAVRTLQRRPFRTVLGAEGRIAWGDLARGALAALIAAGLAQAAMLAVSPALEHGAVGLGQWLILFLPLAALILLQTSAEELIFRGYLLQGLAARFRSPLVWGLLPGLLFTLLHWDAGATPAMAAATLIAVGAFTLTATVLVYRTGRLSAGAGYHLGTNVFGLLVVSDGNWLSGGALFIGERPDSPSWTLGSAAMLSALSIGMAALVLWLLLSRRSPLRLER